VARLPWWHNTRSCQYSRTTGTAITVFLEMINLISIAVISSGIGLQLVLPSVERTSCLVRWRNQQQCGNQIRDWKWRKLFLLRINWDSSFSKVTGHILNDRRSIPGGDVLRHRVQTSSEAHLASHPVNTGCFFLADRSVGTWSFNPVITLHFIALLLFRIQEVLYQHSFMLTLCRMHEMNACWRSYRQVSYPKL
jgi:hypothetical protein